MWLCVCACVSSTLAGQHGEIAVEVFRRARPFAKPRAVKCDVSPTRPLLLQLETDVTVAKNVANRIGLFVALVSDYMGGSHYLLVLSGSSSSCCSS